MIAKIRFRRQRPRAFRARKKERVSKRREEEESGSLCPARARSAPFLSPPRHSISPSPSTVRPPRRAATTGRETGKRSMTHAGFCDDEAETCDLCYTRPCNVTVDCTAEHRCCDLCIRRWLRANHRAHSVDASSSVSSATLDDDTTHGANIDTVIVRFDASGHAGMTLANVRTH